jgi:S-formylglutathione hydrolase FrmB
MDRRAWSTQGRTNFENVKGTRTFHEGLEQHGIRHVYFESAGTAHEWQTWRRCLHGFAPLLFR